MIKPGLTGLPPTAGDDPASRYVDGWTRDARILLRSLATLLRR